MSEGNLVFYSFSKFLLNIFYGLGVLSVGDRIMNKTKIGWIIKSIVKYINN